MSTRLLFISESPRDQRHIENGVAIVELVIIAPLLLFLIAGIVDLGLALRAMQSVTDIAKTGARAAVLQSVNPDLEAPKDCRAVAESGLETMQKALTDSSLTPEDWELQVAVSHATQATPEYPFSGMYEVEATISHKAGVSRCLFCIGETVFGVVPLPTVSGKSVQRLKQMCVSSPVTVRG